MCVYLYTIIIVVPTGLRSYSKRVEKNKILKVTTYFHLCF